MFGPGVLIFHFVGKTIPGKISFFCQDIISSAGFIFGEVNFKNTGGGGGSREEVNFKNTGREEVNLRNTGGKLYISTGFKNCGRIQS